jgi:ABC-2 type transport system ATP-binding protein
LLQPLGIVTDRLRQRLSGSRIVRVQLSGDAAAIEPALAQVPGVARVSRQGQDDGYSSYDVETQAGADVREAIFRLAVERCWTIRELSQTHASLEDVFVHLTTNE